MDLIQSNKITSNLEFKTLYFTLHFSDNYCDEMTDNKKENIPFAFKIHQSCGGNVDIIELETI